MGLAVATGAAAHEFVNYDQAITSAAAKFKDINLATGEGQKTLTALGKTARKVGAETQFSAVEAAGGLDYLAMAGFNAEQAMVSLPKVVDLATVAQTDLARATDIASDALGAFGLMTDDTAQLQKNFTRLNDVMAKTMTTSNTDMETMFEAIKKGAPTFTAAGQSLTSFNALLGKMANSGVKGAEAGTQLRNIMLRLSKPTGEASAVLKKLGIRTQDSSGNFRDVIDILGDFEKATASMGTAQKSAALNTVFGARAVTGINVLLAEGSDSLREYRNMLDASTGAATDMAKTIQGSLQNRIKTLKSAALELGFKFIEAFEERGGSAIDAITKVIRDFDVAPVIHAVETAIKVLKIVFKIIKIAGPGILAAVAAWKSYKLALIVAATAQMIMNGALTTNPIGLVVVAIGVLVAAIVWLCNNWDMVSGWITFVWDKMKVFGEWIKDVFVGAWEFASEKILGIWDKIKTKIVSVWNNISEKITAVWEVLKDPFEAVMKFIKGGDAKITLGIEDWREKRRERREEQREEREQRRGRRRVSTTRETLSRSYSESINRSEITVRNDGTSNVDTDSGVVAPGQRIRLQPSG
jgi:TP901 family phage tail tape measure protein